MSVAGSRNDPQVGTPAFSDHTAKMNRYVAEAVGTFFLVFAGTGAIVVDAVTGGTVTHAGIALTFGMIVMVMIYAVGEISGAHFNPAVTIGFTLARRLLPTHDAPPTGSPRERSLREFADEFGIEGDLCAVRVGAGSPLIGASLGESSLERDLSAKVLAIRRPRRFGEDVDLTPNADTELLEGERQIDHGVGMGDEGVGPREPLGCCFIVFLRERLHRGGEAT